MKFKMKIKQVFPRIGDVICDKEFKNEFHVDYIDESTQSIYGKYMSTMDGGDIKYWPKDIKFYIINSSRYPDITNLGRGLML